MSQNNQTSKSVNESGLPHIQKARKIAQEGGVKEVIFTSDASPFKQGETANLNPEWLRRLQGKYSRKSATGGAELKAEFDSIQKSLNDTLTELGMTKEAAKSEKDDLTAKLKEQSDKVKKLEAELKKATS